MKKNKEESPDKAARRKARTGVQNRLIKELKAIVSQLGIKDAEAVIDYEKEAKKLAKKITKGLKADEPAQQETSKASSNGTVVKAPAKENKIVKEPTAPVSNKKPAAPVVTPAPASKAKTVKAKAQKSVVKENA
jgi:hypothetical protein